MVCQLLEIETTGASLETAVERALRHFGCTRAEIELEVLDAPSRGFLGLFGVRPARIRARLTDRAFIARRIAEELLRLSGLDGLVEAAPGTERIDLLIRSEQSSLIIGRHGQTLEALQHLAVTLTDRVTRDRTSILLDSDNYRSRRSAFLKRLARRLCAQVRHTGKSAVVPALTPGERRILHQVLQDEVGIESRSVGQGTERKMVITARRG